MDGLIIGGTASGVGKTIATLSVIAGLQQHGLTVQPAKCGPDFIDPTHHATLTEAPSRTLDTWMQGSQGTRRNYYRGTGDICVIEGVMGMYDGDVSSTASIAEVLDVPIVLVVEATASMESVAATALGFVEYADEAGYDIDLAGIIAQRAHEGRHEDGIKDALPEHIAYFGRIPPNDDLEIPDRHLGLHLGTENAINEAALNASAQHIQTDRLISAARPPPQPAPRSAPDATNLQIGVALDDAFRFIYPATLERLRQSATIELFSPVNHDPLPQCDALYFPGGYPELHAKELSDSPTMKEVRTQGAAGLPIYGECGGMMVLSESLQTTNGTTYSMAGLLPLSVSMHDRYQALDHTEYTAITDTTIASQTEVRRGHEFHYSSGSPHPDARYAFRVDRGTGITGEFDGITEHNTLGMYGHLHPESGSYDTFISMIEELH